MQIATYVRLAAGIAAACAAALQPAAAAGPADDYPAKPIRMIVPFPAGQPTDTLARTIGAEIGTLAGQTVVVENKPGANAAIGAMQVARAQPDGYTLLFGSNSPMAGNMALFKKPAYDAVADFDPVALVSQTGWMIAVRTGSPYKTIQDLVEAARKAPGTISIGGGTTGYQMAATIIGKNANAPFTVIPYNGTPQLVTDVLGGHVDAISADVGTIGKLVDSGAMRALVAMTPQRVSHFPDVPTLKESGYGEVKLMFSWMGMFAPAGTPRDIREKLAGLVQQAMDSDNAKKYMLEQRMDPSFVASEAFRELQKQDIENYRAAMQYTGTQAQ